MTKKGKVPLPCMSLESLLSCLKNKGFEGVIKHLYLFLLFFCNFLVSGFEQSMIVWSDSGQTQISSIAKNETVIAFDIRHFYPEKVEIAPIPVLVDSYIVIHFENEIQSVVCSRFQQFLTTDDQWIKAIDLKSGDCLQGIEPVYVASTELINKPIVLYDLCVIPHHTFCVGDKKIVVHNVIPFIGLTLSVAFGTGVAEWSLGILAGIAVAGLGIFGCAMNKNHKKSKMTLKPVVSVAISSPGNPNPNDDNDDEDFFKKIKERADKVVRTKKFGSMYRDPETQLWWSCDKAGHGSSCYKVFQETAHGFEWSHNVDMYGNIILRQHKGPVGLFISHKEVIFCR